MMLGRRGLKVRVAALSALAVMSVLVFGFQNCSPQLGDIGSGENASASSTRRTASVAPYTGDQNSDGSDGDPYASSNASQPSSNQQQTGGNSPTGTNQQQTSVNQPAGSNPQQTNTMINPPPAASAGCSDNEIVSNGTSQRAVYFIYCHILKRPPEPAGLTSWSQALGAGTYTMRTMMIQVLHSPEAQTTLGPTSQDFVSWIYTRVLHRTPSGEEVSAWVAAIQRGQETNESIMGRVVNSNELSSLLIRYGY